MGVFSQKVGGCVCLLLVCMILSTGYSQDFGYDGLLGPSNWGSKYKQCVGKHQSPIDITEQDVEVVSLEPLLFRNFEVIPKFYTLQNNGHTVKVTLNSTSPPILSGGPLVGKYILAQFHFHWGSNDEEGSENRVNNNSFPMELHMVFYHYSYGSMSDAMQHPDGLAVLACMFTISEHTNEFYEPIIRGIEKVRAPMSAITVTDAPALEALIPKERNVYFTYGGSLTTPPCTEVVTWIDLNTTIPLTHDQIQPFRDLEGSHGKLIHNFRPTQPIHGRTIRFNKPEKTYRNFFDELLHRNSAQSIFRKEVFYVSVCAILVSTVAVV